MPENAFFSSTLPVWQRLRASINWHLYPDSLRISLQYRDRHGLYPDLKRPRHLSEKTQWLKLHDRSPLHTICADKIRAREYVAARVDPAYLVPLQHTFQEADEIRPERIPAARFALKTNHDQGGVFLCRDRATFDWERVRASVARRLKSSKYPEFREWQYKGVQRGVLVEDFLEAADGGNACELKFYCFNGQPGFVQVVRDRFDSLREAFYTPRWERMDFVGPAPQIQGEVPRPPCLDRLLRDAARLAEPFVFVRIDFLHTGGDTAHFGEVTFHFGAGLIRFRPLEYDRRFGDMIDLSRLPETRRMQHEIARDIDARREARGGTPL
jgi:TupA-like ATPgrasp